MGCLRTNALTCVPFLPALRVVLGGCDPRGLLRTETLDADGPLQMAEEELSGSRVIGTLNPKPTPLQTACRVFSD